MPTSINENNRETGIMAFIIQSVEQFPFQELYLQQLEKTFFFLMRSN